MGQKHNSVLQKVDAKTNLVGSSRLELLLFRLSGKQTYGINVFKVREVINCPAISKLPQSHPAIIGITNTRGKTFIIIDLQSAMGMPGAVNIDQCSVIVTEYNQKMQGFLVPHIDHIINQQWEDIHAPPRIVGEQHYLTGVTQIDDEIIEILDVEKVLFEISGESAKELEVEANEQIEMTDLSAGEKPCHILIVDDSSVARNQIKRTLSGLNLHCTLRNDGRAALELLEDWAEANSPEFQQLVLVISDVEMPEMDGYTLTAEIRKHEKLKHLKILLHTSLSGVFDSSLLENVKADGFLAKFNRDELLKNVKAYIDDFTQPEF